MEYFYSLKAADLRSTGFEIFCAPASLFNCSQFHSQTSSSRLGSSMNSVCFTEGGRLCLAWRCISKLSGETGFLRTSTINFLLFLFVYFTKDPLSYSNEGYVLCKQRPNKLETYLPENSRLTGFSRHLIQSILTCLTFVIRLEELVHLWTIYVWQKELQRGRFLVRLAFVNKPFWATAGTSLEAEHH